MIRTFFPLDLTTILFQGGSLSNKAITKDNIGKKDTRFITLAALIGQWFNPQSRKCIWVWTRGLGFRGLASARNRSSARAWEIDRLLINEDDKECCYSLLERLIYAGCESGVEKIFLRLSIDNPLATAAKQAGFIPYSTEFLYGSEERRASSNAEKNSLNSRLKQVADEYRLFELYQNSFPPLIRKFEGMTFSEWQDTKDKDTKKEWVFEKEDALVGWLRLRGSDDIGKLEIMAGSEEYLEQILSFTLYSLNNYSQLFYLTREFQGELKRLLINQGLDELESYSVFIKELTVKTKEPCLVPMGA